MELKQFEGERKEEIAMIRVAKAVLEEEGKVMSFNDLINEVANFIEISEAEKKNRMAQFYTDMNVDGEFISLGENQWGLRNWYPVDSINEVLTHENDEADMIPTISPDGFDDYDAVALEAEIDEEAEIEVEKDDEDTLVDIDGDGSVENLDEYQDDLDADDLGDDELDELTIVDEDDLLDEDLDEEDEDDL